MARRSSVYFEYCIIYSPKLVIRCKRCMMLLHSLPHALSSGICSVFGLFWDAMSSKFWSARDFGPEDLNP